MIPFHVDDYMRDRAAGIMLLLGETRNEVEERILRDIIRDAKDLVRRLEAKLPGKGASDTDRYALYGWIPRGINGANHQYVDSYRSRKAAISAALDLVAQDFDGLQFFKIMDNEELRTVEILIYPSLKWRGEDVALGKNDGGMD